MGESMAVAVSDVLTEYLANFDFDKIANGHKIDKDKSITSISFRNQNDIPNFFLLMANLF